MQFLHRWIDRDLARLELVIACSIILVLVGVFARHMLLVFARAEQSMVNRTVINIDTALKYQAVFFIMKDDYRDLARLADLNPMDTMQGGQMDTMLSSGVMKAQQLTSGFTSLVKPANYLGSFDDPDPGSLQKGSWYYDAGRHELVYLVRNSEYFYGGTEDVPLLRYRTPFI